MYFGFLAKAASTINAVFNANWNKSCSAVQRSGASGHERGENGIGRFLRFLTQHDTTRHWLYLVLPSPCALSF